jgi:hypothetical protein
VKKILFLFATTLIVFARINPFVPVIKPNKIKVVKPTYFHKVSVYLPSTARVLKQIIFVYQTLDSDVKRKTVVINKNIDFHAPIVVTHHPETLPMIKSDFGIFTLYAENKKILINTRDKLLRAFFLVKPFRLVLDFKRPSDFYTIKKNFSSFIKKVVVGSHGDFYRVVIYLDANYAYKIKRTPQGVEIELR